jgi:hypothetical protein
MGNTAVCVHPEDASYGSNGWRKDNPHHLRMTMLTWNLDSQSGDGTLDPFEWGATREDAQLGCHLLVLLLSFLAGNSGQATLQTD